MFSKIEVNGDGACALYQWLRAESGGDDIRWNFEKFLVDGEGRLVQRFDPMTTPEQIEPTVAGLV